MNALQSTSQWKDYFGNPTGSVLGVVNAAQSIGRFISLPSVGHLSDRFGRRIVLLSGAISIIIASTIQAASVKLRHVRIFKGACWYWINARCAAFADVNNGSGLPYTPRPIHQVYAVTHSVESKQSS